MKTSILENTKSIFVYSVATIGMTLIWAIISLLWAWPIELLWNRLVPAFFKLRQITFWEAYGLELLAGMLFGTKMTFNHSNVYN